MLLKCLTILCLTIIAAHATALRERTILVKVVYDDAFRKIATDEEVADLQKKSEQKFAATKEITVPTQVQPVFVPDGRRNLDEKIQLSPEELQENKLKQATKPSDEVQPALIGNVRKNLDEKIQLSIDDLRQNVKHLPVSEENAEKPASELPETVDKVTVEENKPSTTLALIHQAEEIVSNGLATIKNNIAAELPNAESWDELNKSVQNFFQAEKNRLDIKQDQAGGNQNILQVIASGIQNITSNFVQNFQQGQQASAGNTTNQGDEQQPGGGGGGGFQNIISTIQGGVQGIISNINNLGNRGSTTISTVLGDNGSTPPPNILQSFVSNVQQFFTGNQPKGNATQGDTGSNQTTASSGPQNPVEVIQAIGGQVGNAINQIIQGAQGNKPPAAAGDDGVTPAPQPPNLIQNIGNAIQNLNPFRPTDKPIVEQVSEGIQNVGNQIQQQLGQKPGVSPVESIQNAAGSVAGGLIDKPVTESAEKEKKIDEILESSNSKKKEEEIMIFAD